MTAKERPTQATLREAEDRLRRWHYHGGDAVHGDLVDAYRDALVADRDAELGAMVAPMTMTAEDEERERDMDASLGDGVMWAEVDALRRALAASQSSAQTLYRVSNAALREVLDRVDALQASLAKTSR